MAKFVILKRGQGGKVAINAELVTDIRSTAGAFTDVYCGDHQITVEGTFEQVMSLFVGLAEREPAQHVSPRTSRHPHPFT